MHYIKIITLAFCLLCSCQNNAQKQDKYLYGNICLTDKQCIYNRLLLNILYVINQKYGLNL